MLRPVDLALVALMVSAAALTYKVKHQAEAKLAEVERLQAEIRLQEDTIDLLEADWSLLNQPARLQALIERYEEALNLQTTEPHQVATLEEVPRRPLDLEPPASERPEVFAQVPSPRPDRLATGSVAR